MPQGRKKKPTSIKIQEGNRRKVGKDHLQPDLAGIGVVAMPDELTQVEQRLWRKVVASLPEGLLTRADEGVLERFVVAWARFRSTTKSIAATGLIVKSGDGWARNPLLVVQNHAAKEMHAAGSELGLSPVARARLAAPTFEANDPMAMLLGDGLDPAAAWSTAPVTKQ
jgi:P27 family predicted phage terminase small subunit